MEQHTTSICDPILWRSSIGIFPGRFNIPHFGHIKVFNELKNYSDSVKIQTRSTEVSFEDKVKLFGMLGVDSSAVIDTLPYRLPKNLKDIDTVIFGIGAKDKTRFPFTDKSYFQPYQNKSLDNHEKHSYIAIIETCVFELLGVKMKSSTDIKNLYRTNKKEVVLELYGTLDAIEILDRYIPNE